MIANQTYVPAEWAPQAGVILTWPHSHSDWRDDLPEVVAVFLQIAQHICRYEQLIIACWDQAHLETTIQLLQQHGIDLHRVALYVVPSNDTWTRDYGPISIHDGSGTKLLNFTFNGWGGKYDASLDNLFNSHLSAQQAFGTTPLEPIALVLEGGALEVDGEGTLLSTTRCLLSHTRNPGISAAQLRERLSELLGVRRFLWLHHGYLAGDDTDGHIDMLARFCNKDTIAYIACDDPADEHYHDLQAMKQELEAFTTADGRPYKLVALPWPQAKIGRQGRRLPASYANFLVINHAVLIPTYADPADKQAVAVLQGCFPDREIIPIPCLALIRQNGSLHCVTMQLPHGVWTSPYDNSPSPQ